MTPIFVHSRKKSEFAGAESSLVRTLNEDLGLKLKNIHIYNTYIIEKIEQELLDLGKKFIFSEPFVEELFDKIPTDLPKFSIKLLDAQYDNKADWAMQLFSILEPDLKVVPNIKTATTYVFDFSDIGAEGEEPKVSLTKDEIKTQIEAIKNYLVNPVDSESFDIDKYEFSKIENTQNDEISLEDQIKDLSMDEDDLNFVREYYKRTGKQLNALELKVLDTYWSDHCRHTTFTTELEIETDEVFKEHLNFYLNQRKELGIKKPVTLMDLATITTKWIRKNNPKRCENIDISEEINACSIKTKVNGEDYIIMFKNETHNHPTEIEPFGGAATCLGGAIRDPLSGRTFVYQSMRISGSADPREKIENTLNGKLPQKKICQEAAHGFSSYGNQIGLATGYVDEIYHEGYKAKRLETGALIASAPYTNIRREKPVPGDIVVLLGGLTGRDGIGGATGSSKVHDENSVKTQSSEVQKGNAIVERKIQRLFRNPELTKFIKKCNDFGAGGVSVAVGELADSLEIFLDKVPTKYKGLTPLEIAVSESQERMAVVIDPKDFEEFEKLANEENLDAFNIANVTNSGRLIMKYNEEVVLDLERSFIDTNGSPKKNKAKISKSSLPMPKYSSVDEMLKDINICAKTGLVEMFDSSVGGNNLTHPFGGKTQNTKADTMVSQVFRKDQTMDSNRATIMSYGFDVKLMKAHPFTGGKAAILSAVAKAVASGAKVQDLYLSLQEYFPKPTTPDKWGEPLKALLGANFQASKLEIPIIGGKDSMSGNFKDLEVPNTLIAFIAGTLETKNVITNEFKNENSYVYLVDNFDLPKETLSAKAIDKGGVAEAIIKAGLGNLIGFELENDEIDLLDPSYGKIIVETSTKIKNGIFLGKTNGTKTILGKNIEDLLGIITGLKEVYPTTRLNTLSYQTPVISNSKPTVTKYSKQPIEHPRVFIPVFPGTNSEDDSARVYERLGAIVSTKLFVNRTKDDIEKSIEVFANEIKNANILFIPGGFSAADEPNGSAKFITNVLRNPKIERAINELLENEGLILGICNGFQALVKTGLLPYGKIVDPNDIEFTLTNNLNGKHISRLVETRVLANPSPFFTKCSTTSYHIPISHGEGRFMTSTKNLNQLIENNQIACVYEKNNPNGSLANIEAITSKDGRILGKMGHSERTANTQYLNIPLNQKQEIFESSISYFRDANK